MSTDNSQPIPNGVPGPYWKNPTNDKHINILLDLGNELCKAFGHAYNIEYDKDTPQINLIGKSTGMFGVDIMFINATIQDINNDKKITRETLKYLEDLHNSYDL